MTNQHVFQSVLKTKINSLNNEIRVGLPKSGCRQDEKTKTLECILPLMYGDRETKHGIVYNWNSLKKAFEKFDKLIKQYPQLRFMMDGHEGYTNQLEFEKGKTTTVEPLDSYRNVVGSVDVIQFDDKTKTVQGKITIFGEHKTGKLLKQIAEKDLPIGVSVVLTTIGDEIMTENEVKTQHPEVVLLKEQAPELYDFYKKSGTKSDYVLYTYPDMIKRIDVVQQPSMETHTSVNKTLVLNSETNVPTKLVVNTKFLKTNEIQNSVLNSSTKIKTYSEIVNSLHSFSDVKNKAQFVNYYLGVIEKLNSLLNSKEQNFVKELINPESTLNKAFRELKKKNKKSEVSELVGLSFKKYESVKKKLLNDYVKETKKEFKSLFKVLRKETEKVEDKELTQFIDDLITNYLDSNKNSKPFSTQKNLNEAVEKIKSLESKLDLLSDFLTSKELICKYNPKAKICQISSNLENLNKLNQNLKKIFRNLISILIVEQLLNFNNRMNLSDSTIFPSVKNLEIFKSLVKTKRKRKK